MSLQRGEVLKWPSKRSHVSIFSNFTGKKKKTQDSSVFVYFIELG